MLRNLLEGDDNPLLVRESTDYFARIAINLRDNRGIILFKGTDIGKVAGPHVPKGAPGAGGKQNDDQCTPKGNLK